MNALPHRARDLGIVLGRLVPGHRNAITDVPGVQVGHCTVRSGDGPLIVGQGPVRTGVTVVLPRGRRDGGEPVFAAYHILNGNGEMTGLPWIDEAGQVSAPIAITNTHSVGVVRDAIIRYLVVRAPSQFGDAWCMPVVAETYDGFLSDINGMHVRTEHVFTALDDASDGSVSEGCVGGGTGMICHGFKGGIGTASRLLPPGQGGWTVGALVQANYGERGLLRIDGVPVGMEIGPDEVPLPESATLHDAGSIIVILATDAPLLPSQCRRLAQRASLGIAKCGGIGANSSGDLFLAFATGNTGLDGDPSAVTVPLHMVRDPAITPLFEAAVEATEEAIVNALCAAETTVGRDGHTAHALPHDRLQAVMHSHGRLRAR